MHKILENPVISSLKKIIEKYFEEIVNIRRHLHRNPELSFQEFETIKYIKSILLKLNLEYKEVTETGLEVIIKGNKKNINKTLLLRADIDALPIQEKNDVIYRSKNDGVMHACGHDVHTSSLIGVIKVLNELKNEFGGTIKFIFQPGEEKIPGGASLMIKEGILKNPRPDAAFGLHVTSGLPVGKIGFCKKEFCASGDEIFLTILGKGGHASMPDKLIDPILIASHVIVGLQSIISRNRPPLIPSVLSFGKIEAEGGETNIIPDKVIIKGTFRALNEEWREKAHALITKFVTNCVESMGGTCKVDIKKGYPCLINNEELVAKTIKLGCEYLGEENIKILEPCMFAEDFAYFAQKIPSCFYVLGVANENKKITSQIHTSTFDIDEEALKVSIGFMSYIAISYLA